jgi:hypothetical protein
LPACFALAAPKRSARHLAEFSRRVVARRSE